MHSHSYCCITFVLLFKFAKVIQVRNVFTPPLQTAQLVTACVPAPRDTPRTPNELDTHQAGVSCDLIMPHDLLRTRSTCALARVYGYMRAIAPEAATRPRQRAAYFLRCLGEAHAAARALPSGWEGVLCVSVRHAAYLQTYDIDVEEVISRSSRRLPPASTLYSKKMASTSAMKRNFPSCSSMISSKSASVVACASVQSPICCKRSYRMRIMRMVCKVRGYSKGSPN
jgi:hypothetical protein